jgi:hypothetical protein
MGIEHQCAKRAMTKTYKAVSHHKAPHGKKPFLARLHQMLMAGLQSEHTPQAPSRPPSRYRGALVPCPNSAMHAQTIPFDKSERRATLGRYSLACKPEAEKSLSRRHFQLTFGDTPHGDSYISDMSKCGTYLNGELISSGLNFRLQDGTRISVVDPDNDCYVTYIYRQPYAPNDAR